MTHNRLVLGNASYLTHTTDEGHQLQAGLFHAGWQIAGKRLAINMVDVPSILAMTQPEMLLVQDVRDWSPDSSGCFDPSVCFQRIDALANCPATKLTVVKDAGSLVDYQRRFAERIKADAIIHYYHEQSILKVSAWLSIYPLIRIYHSVDAAHCRLIDITGPRKRGLVSGAVSGVYPLRQKAFASSRQLGLDTLTHPGYHNRGCQTPEYLRTLARYKVHVATASSFHFALRKIIESIAMGCTPITNLPAYDVLPEIDEALIRIPDDISIPGLRAVIDQAAADWDLGRAMYFADLARAYYDYQRAGERLDQACRALRVAA